MSTSSQSKRTTARAQSAARRLGRPSSYTEAVGVYICSQIATGRSLVSIVRDDPCMPEYSTVIRWLDAHESFRSMYARAREDQADYLADEIVTIADSATGNEDANARRLQVDARKWVAAKLRPRKYGDHQRVEHAGPDGGAIPHAIEVKFVDAPAPDVTKK